jgi:methionyl-tRNA synthetase
MMNLARLGNKYLADTEPWILIKTDEEKVKTILNLSLQITANLAVIAEPFLPFSAQKLRKMLNIDTISWNKAGDVNLLETGHVLGKPELLFAKIEDMEIEKQLQKLANTKKANEVKNVSVSPQKPDITYEDFLKIDIRSGKVLAAEKVAKTNKLMKLTIDTGIDKRTVVSGIAEGYEPEQVVGRQVSIIVNLESKNLRGIESHGMILMASDTDGRLVFVSPVEEIKNGSEIK